MSELHLEQFRKEGIDYDLKNPRTRWRQLIADLRYCLPKGSFVITNSIGTKSIESFKTGDKVYVGSSSKVLKCFERDYQGRMIKINYFIGLFSATSVFA